MALLIMFGAILMFIIPLHPSGAIPINVNTPRIIPFLHIPDVATIESVTLPQLPLDLEYFKLERKELPTIEYTAITFYCNTGSGLESSTEGDGSISNPWKSVNYALTQLKDYVACFAKHTCYSCFRVQLKCSGVADYSIYCNDFDGKEIFVLYGVHVSLSGEYSNDVIGIHNLKNTYLSNCSVNISASSTYPVIEFSGIDARLCYKCAVNIYIQWYTIETGTSMVVSIRGYKDSIENSAECWDCESSIESESSIDYGNTDIYGFSVISAINCTSSISFNGGSGDNYGVGFDILSTGYYQTKLVSGCDSIIMNTPSIAIKRYTIRGFINTGINNTEYIYQCTATCTQISGDSGAFWEGNGVVGFYSNVSGFNNPTRLYYYGCTTVCSYAVSTYTPPTNVYVCGFLFMGTSYATCEYCYSTATLTGNPTDVRFTSGIHKYTQNLDLMILSNCTGIADTDKTDVGFSANVIYEGGISAGMSTYNCNFEGGYCWSDYPYTYFCIEHPYLE